MCSVQIFIDTSKYSHTIFLTHGEVLSGQTANIHHIVNVTRGQAQCGNGSG